MLDFEVFYLSPSLLLLLLLLVVVVSQVSQIKHYPPADGEPAATDLARFLWPDVSWTEGRERLLLGNGES